MEAQGPQTIVGLNSIQGRGGRTHMGLTEAHTTPAQVSEGQEVPRQMHHLLHLHHLEVHTSPIMDKEEGPVDMGDPVAPVPRPKVEMTIVVQIQNRV